MALLAPCRRRGRRQSGRATRRFTTAAVLSNTKHWRLFFHHTTTFRVLFPVTTSRSSPSTVSWVAFFFLGKTTPFLLLQVQIQAPCFRFCVIRHDIRSGSPSQIAGPQPPARQKHPVAGSGCSGTSCVTGSVDKATQQLVVERTNCNSQLSSACICSRNHSSLPQYAGS
jgi:hypothetical protein